MKQLTVQHYAGQCSQRHGLSLGPSSAASGFITGVPVEGSATYIGNGKDQHESLDEINSDIGSSTMVFQFWLDLTSYEGRHSTRSRTVYLEISGNGEEFLTDSVDSWT